MVLELTIIPIGPERSISCSMRYFGGFIEYP